VNVYAETNFVLEMALRQEQCYDFENVVSLCRQHRVHLIIPAYSLAEPYETLIRRHRGRKKLKNTLDTELNQLARTASYTSDILKIQDLLNILMQSTEDEMRRFEKVKNDLLDAAEIIPLNSEIIRLSSEHQREHDLSPQDALVYASVLYHLQQTKPDLACFLNKNSKDFDDLNILDVLEHHRCKMLSRCPHGYQFIFNKIN
jgi:predicted nucleic acid-binding protein